MKRTLPALLLFALTGCTWELAEDRYFAKPSAQNATAKAGHKTIWSDKHQILGYVEIQTSTLAGSKDQHTDWFVKDVDNNLVGFITEKGQTYRFKRSSPETDHIGNYTINDGIRNLLQISSSFELAPTRIED